MNTRSLAATATVALILACAGALAAAEPKMAFVSMERLFDEYHKTKTANAQLKTRFDDVDGKRRGLLAEVKTIKSETDALGAEARDKSLSDAERAKKKLALDDKLAQQREAEAKLMEFDTDYRKQLGDQMRKTQQQLVGEIRAVIQAYVRERGFQVVFDSSGKTLNNVESVVYYDPAMDITEPVLAILNKTATEPESGKKTP